MDDATTPRYRSGNKTHDGSGNKLFGTLALLIVVAIASFFGGVAYQKGHQNTTSSSSIAGSTGQFQPGRFGGGRRLGGFGTVTAIHSSSITIKRPRSGTTSSYAITSTTSVLVNGSTGSTSNIQIGDTVIVRTSSPSSTTATQIIVNPSFNRQSGAPSGTPTMTN